MIKIKTLAVAAMMSAAVLTSSLPAMPVMAAETTETETSTNAAFYYGSESKYLGAGTYNLGATLMKSDDTSSSSMAASAVKGAVLKVAKDGSATLDLTVGSITVGTITASASDWTAYTDSTMAEALESTSVANEDGTETVTFAIPDTSADGVYLSMVAMSRTMNAYLAYNYSTAEKVANDANYFGSDKQYLAAGKYTVDTTMMKATDLTSKSMAAGAIRGAVLNVAEDGSATLDLTVGSITVYGVTASASDWTAYTDETVSEKVESTSVTNEDETETVTFAIPDTSADGVFIGMSMQGRAQTAYLYIDYSTAKEVSEETPVIVKLTSGNVTLSTTSYTYTGKAKKPSVTVKVDGKKLTSGTDYTVAYKNNTNVGKATVTVTGKGNYTGTVTKTFKINPKATTVTSVKNYKGKKAKVSWTKVSGVTGYYVYRATSKNGTYKKVATVKKSSTKCYYNKKLTKKKTYYYKVKAYKTVSGTTYTSAYSNIKSVKIKK